MGPAFAKLRRGRHEQTRISGQCKIVAEVDKRFARARACPLTSRSAATLHLRDVTFDLLVVEADNSANATAAAIIHLHVREGLNVVLLRRARIGDLDLAQRNVGLGLSDLDVAR